MYPSLRLKRPAALIFTALITLLLIGLPITHAQTESSSGQLAIAGADGNIHLYDPATSTTTQISTDGDNRFRRFDWPTWSTDGRLAYFGVSVAEDDAYSLGIFVQPAAGGEAAKVYSSNRENFTYAYWSPGDCPVGNCRDLAVLASPNGAFFTLKRVRVSDRADPETTDLGEGAPFYWDWSPDGQSMLWARFSESLEVYDSAADEIALTYDETQGFQRAVDWSPIDNRLLSAVLNEDGTSDLIIFKGQTRTPIAEGLRSVVAFEWSPDGQHIAYLDGQDGTLTVVDGATGKFVATPATATIAFFWSPDSSKIAYLTLGQTNSGPAARPNFQAIILEWHVYDLATDSSFSLSSFVPTKTMIYYLSFFDQFARSHRLWSPDSRYLAYGEELGDGSQQVSLVDVTTPGSAPQSIMAGAIGIFSWH